MRDKCRLEGAKFILSDASGKQLMCVVTDARGEACIDNLPYGTYYLREVEAPCGYAPCADEVEIVISECNENRTVEFVNRCRYGSIKIIKYGE